MHTQGDLDPLRTLCAGKQISYQALCIVGAAAMKTKWLVMGRGSRLAGSRTRGPANAWLQVLPHLASNNVCFEVLVFHLLPEDSCGLMCFEKDGTWIRQG